MDDNISRILQMLQDGRINVREAATLIAAVRGEAPQSESGASEEKEKSTCCTFTFPYQGILIPWWLLILFLLPRRRRCR
ncbi:MAG: hypothetical protein RMJ43_02340 [Chloroherpetonaceae bacterium]|nr:hypothetical protein [Chthonomonadaceae bacterium]MDW8206648.1 hypothetical protein [Chloroherpetonaceae bacterium]